MDAPLRLAEFVAARRRPVTRVSAGCVQTVLGPVAPASLGVVMPHEHLFVDLTCMFDMPTEASDRSRASAPFSLEHLGWIRTHYFRHLPNLVLDDEELAADEVGLYKAAGGSTIVDVSTPGIGRDPLALARLARTTGVHVIMATGFYVASTHPPEVAAMTEDDVARRMVAEIEAGSCSDRPQQATRIGIRSPSIPG